MKVMFMHLNKNKEQKVEKERCSKLNDQNHIKGLIKHFIFECNQIR